LDPAFHERVHPGQLDAGVGEDRVEQGGVLAVPITDEETGAAAGVL
jgi:hypothetical protein